MVPVPCRDQVALTGLAVPLWLTGPATGAAAVRRLTPPPPTPTKE